MPAMIRPRGKAQRIAFSIIGVPAVFQDKETKKERRITRLIRKEDTRLVR